jgi:hypothetical protein
MERVGILRPGCERGDEHQRRRRTEASEQPWNRLTCVGATHDFVCSDTRIDKQAPSERRSGAFLSTKKRRRWQRLERFQSAAFHYSKVIVLASFEQKLSPHALD